MLTATQESNRLDQDAGAHANYLDMLSTNTEQAPDNASRVGGEVLDVLHINVEQPDAPEERIEVNRQEST